MTIAKKLLTSAVLAALSLSLANVAQADIPPFNGNKRPRPQPQPVVPPAEDKETKDVKGGKDADAAADKKEKKAKHHKKDKSKDKAEKKPAAGT